MPEVFDFAQDHVVNIPDEAVAAAVGSGQFGLHKGEDVPVIAPDGQRGTVPADKAGDAFRAGYQFETEAQRQEYEKEQKYGHGVAPLQAGLEGAARGATFGLSDLVLSKSGLIDREGMAERQKRNPVAAIGGELASAAFLNPLGQLGIGARVAGKLGAAGDAALRAAGAAPKAVSAAGSTLEHIGAKTVGALAGGEGSLLARAAGKALGLAVESEAYNIAHNLSEAALGDKEITAERLLAHSGQALAVGAGLGFAMPVAAAAGHALAEKAKAAIDRTTGLLRDRVLPGIAGAAVEPVAGMSAAASGAAKADIAQAIHAPFTPGGMAYRKDLIAGLTPEARDKIAREFMGSLDESFKATKQATRQAFERARPQEVERLLADVPIQGAATKAEEMLGAAKNAIAEMRAQPDVFTQRGLISKLETTVNGFENRLVDDGVSSTAELFNLADDFKRTIDKQVAKWGKNISPEAIDTVDKVRGVRDLVKGFLEDPEAFGDAAVRQQQFNAAFAAQKNTEKELLRLFGDKAVSPSGAPYRKLSSVKIDTYLRQVGSGRGDIRDAALQDWLKASRDLTEQIAESHAKAGVEGFDKAGLQSLLDKSMKARGTAEQQFADLNKLRALDPFGQFGSSQVVLGGLPGIAKAMVDQIKSPSALVKTLSAAEGFALGTSKRIGQAVDAFTSVAKKGAAALPARELAAPVIVHELGKAFGADVDTKPRRRADAGGDKKAEAFDKAMHGLSAMVSNPSNAAAKLEGGLTHLSEHAPETRNAVVAKQLSAAQFLYEKAPKNDTETSLNPFIESWRPSDAEIAQWERYAAAVQDPLGVLDEIEAGTVSSEAIEALRAVYPNLYNEIQQTFAGKIGELRKQLPYQKRLTLSMLFDLPVDASTTPQFVAAMQSAHGQAIQEEQQHQATLRASANVDLATPHMTSSQRIASK